MPQEFFFPVHRKNGADLWSPLLDLWLTSSAKEYVSVTEVVVRVRSHLSLALPSHCLLLSLAFLACGVGLGVSGFGFFCGSGSALAPALPACNCSATSPLFALPPALPRCGLFAA